MSDRLYPEGLPLPLEKGETLAEAICCDTAFRPFAEPQHTFELDDVDLWGHVNKSGITTFYDSVCGIPLFNVPMNRTFAEFQAETEEHGWPSFRPAELVAGAITIDPVTNYVTSACGTHLGTNLPEGGYDRYCLDLSCVAGNPVKAAPKEAHGSAEAAAKAALAALAAPDAANIVQLAQATPDLSTLVSALVAGNLTGALDTAGPFTVFAPSNEAFVALPAGTLARLLDPVNVKALQNLLLYHVHAGELLSKDILPEQQVLTLQGGHILVSKDWRVEPQTILLNRIFHVTTADVLASNGVVHIIDGVFQP
jgi:uncharacterized surface protein with fasciclin (FAS1) repeats